MFHINNFKMVIIDSLDNIWAEIKPTKRILIRFHEDEFVSFDDYVELVADTVLDLVGLLFSEEHQWMHQIKLSLGLVEHF